MEIISAKNARSKFAEILDLSRDYPVTIQKHGKDFAVLISNGRYKELVKMEEEMLSLIAADIDKKNEYLSKDESKKIIDSILDA
ncbi:MAG: type II toxin-antitoxin system Phd/YefM family antitoxin [Rickettsiales bacterium]